MYSRVTTGVCFTLWLYNVRLQEVKCRGFLYRLYRRLSTEIFYVHEVEHRDCTLQFTWTGG